MSTVGFQAPTPANGATLNVNRPYAFRIGVTDDSMAASAIVLPMVAAGTATIDPAEAHAIDDGALPGANFADWTVTPTAAGALTIDVAVTEGEMMVDAGAGSRTFTVVSAAAPRSAALSLGLRLGL